VPDFFRPILAGATLRDRALACLGALVAIATTGVIAGLFTGRAVDAALLVGPIGASAVLLFAVPASPLAQPWPIIGGNTLSAAVGVAMAALVPEPALAAGLAVALAIGLMSVTRSLHPPGGAAALIGALATGPSGLLFPLVPVAMDAVLLVGLGYLFHRVSGHRYPHRPSRPAGVPTASTDLPPDQRAGFSAADLDAALNDVGEAFDISREDVALLLRQVELRALERRRGPLTVEAVMTRDVVHIDIDDHPERARSVLLATGLRILPAVDGEGKVHGAIGLRELTRTGASVGELMSPMTTTSRHDSVFLLAPILTDGRTHAVAVVDGGGRLEGLVTQTDLLAAFTSRGTLA